MNLCMSVNYCYIYSYNRGETDEELKTAIVKFVAKDSYKKWCHVFQAKPISDNDDMMTDKGVVSLEMIKVLYELAEAWKSLLLVALHYHVSLHCITFLYISIIRNQCLS